MKTLLISGLLAAGAFAGLQWNECCPGCCDEAAPSGSYVEARTATVFGGACHVNAELMSQGRRALLAWTIEAGAWDGVDLAGTALVASVSSGANLATGEARTSELWIDARDARAADAAARWLAATQGPALGQVEARRSARITSERSGDAFEVRVEGVLTLAGDALADRSCCSMPDHRWYEPLAAGAIEAVVGVARACRFQGAGDHAPWTYEGANNVFVARF